VYSGISNLFYKSIL